LEAVNQKEASNDSLPAHFFSQEVDWSSHGKIRVTKCDCNDCGAYGVGIAIVDVCERHWGQGRTWRINGEPFSVEFPKNYKYEIV